MTAAGGSPDLTSWDYSQASRHCDVVMKGGISSGVVYPLAVCELARTYRFKNVGGTSAGAIAAAATAAAEYGRDSGSFGHLAALPDEIGAPGRLSGLFQAEPGTRGLFRILMTKLGHGFWAAAGMAALSNPVAVVLGALPGVLVVVLAARNSGALAGLGLVFGAFLVLVGIAVALVVRLVAKLMRAVPENGYGLCSGWSSRSQPGDRPLTDWLHEKLNDYAGLVDPPDRREKVLTFGHLWAGPGGDQANPPVDPKDRHVQLAMMTTNLTNRRAHQLPWGGEGGWFFCPSEFGALFPPEVVSWMEEKSVGEAVEAEDSRGERRTLLPLPEGKDMPVIVATRLSLSFPVLLSCVPLWRRGERGHERCWFSDGGISSNFPVHFFDRLVPRWPTFAVNLRPFRDPGDENERDQRANTGMVTMEAETIPDWWYRLPERGSFWFWRDHRLFEFLTGIVRTMQNRIDEAQMRVPGYRDRVAHVYLSKSQGGLNLAMDKPTIDALTERGRFAAERLREAYTVEAVTEGEVGWDSHRWIRLRSALAVLEDMHGRFDEGYNGEVEPPGAPQYKDLLDALGSGLVPDYGWTGPEQRQLAQSQVEAIKVSVEEVTRDRTVSTRAPDPLPEGRVEPRD